MRGVRLREVKNFEFGKEIHFPRPQVSAYGRCPFYVRCPLAEVRLYF